MRQRQRERHRQTEEGGDRREERRKGQGGGGREGRRSGEEIVSGENRSREGDGENPGSVRGTVDTVEAVPDLS